MGDVITTHFMNVLSILIPFSELSFSKILRANINKITDQTLSTQVRAMIKQEGRHAAMHLKSNV
ncbi:MAG: putative metal-dependent hydrolase [Psychrobacter glaciei]|jgi:predicted metal-dependent hydrolase